MLRGVAALLLFAWAGWAQDTRGQIIGRVQDPTGAPVAGAKVRGINLLTNITSSTVTSSSGDYVLPFLIPGPYAVSVEHEGFHRFLQKDIEVQVDQKTTVNVKLELGSVTESVNVAAENPLLDLSDAGMSQTVDSRSITELPLKDGNPLMLIELSPGVMNLASGGMTRPFDNGNTSSMVVNGSRTGTNEYRIDGAPNTGGSSGNVAYIPPSGVVSEVKVQTNPFSAGSGFSTGATVNVALKSGTNRIHGQVYHFVQNPVLNANAFFSNLAGLPKDNYRQNRFGANANGPVMLPFLYKGRNRTFWMFGYEGIRDSLPRPSDGGTYTVPAPAQRQGDFSNLLAVGGRYQIYDPATTAPSGNGRYSRSPFAGNIIPVARLHPAAIEILDRYMPSANVRGAVDGTNNFIMSLVEKNRFASEVFRVDHSISEKNRFFVRGSYNNRYQELERRFNDAAGFNYFRNNRGFGIDDTHIFATTFLLNVRYNYTRYTEDTEPFTRGLDLTTLGFSNNYLNQIKSANASGLMLPDIAISGYPEFNATSPGKSANDIHALGIAFTKLARSHTITFGGEHRVYRDTRSSLGRSSGNLSFGTNWTHGPDDNSASSPLGQGLASFLLGLPTGGYYDINASYAQQYQVTGWYVQDSWKLSPRLTVDLGLRWEAEAPTTERFNRAIRGYDFVTPSPIAAQVEANYAKNPIPQIAAQDFKVIGGLTFAGVNGQPRPLWDANKRNVAPRAAIAWQVERHTVIRMGYGIFYDIARQSVDQTGFSRQTTLIGSNDTGQTYIGGLENPFPNGFLQPAGSSMGLLTNIGQSVNPKYTHLLDPYVQRWQFSIQRSLGRRAILEVAYVGNRSTHLRTTRSLDSVPLQYLSTLPVRDNATNGILTRNVPNPYFGLVPASTGLSGATIQVQQLLRPFTQFTGGNTTSNEGYSWFHSMQTRVERRFTAGYLFTAAWTWSKFMDATGFLNGADPVPNRVISDQDRTHRLATSSIYELPFGRGRRWASSWQGLAGKLVQGWQAQSIYQWQSGAPLGFGDIPFNGDFNSIPLPRDQRTAERWFNTSAGFDRNSADAYVVHVRTFPVRVSGLRGMGLNMADLSASKNTNITEKMSLQFRAEFINALNHTHFNTPQMNPFSTVFGRISSTAQQPRNIQFGLRLVF